MLRKNSINSSSSTARHFSISHLSLWKSHKSQRKKNERKYEKSNLSERKIQRFHSRFEINVKMIKEFFYEIMNSSDE